MNKTLGIGLDFGNSNSTLAVYDGKTIEYISIDSKGIICPSALYLDKEIQASIGTLALQKYLHDNTNRKIIFKRTHLGNIQVTMGEMDRDHYVERDRTFIAAISAKVDSNLPGRLFCSIKAYLGNKEHDRFSVFNKNFSTQALCTILIREMIKQSSLSNINQITVGRPVHFSGDNKEASTIAEGRLRTALQNAGVSSVHFLKEPIAAAKSYYASHRHTSSENVLVFDFGGGTLDLCLLKMDKTEMKVLSVGGVPLAGDAIDREILKNKIFSELGQGAKVLYKDDTGWQENLFPFSDFIPFLLNWQSSYILYQPRYREPLLKAIEKSTGKDKSGLIRLDKLIQRNGSFELLKIIEKAKIELSEHEKTHIIMEEIDLSVEISREDLSIIVQPILGKIQNEIKETLKKADLLPEQIDRTICTGGSSQLAGIETMLNELFPGTLEDYDNFKSIAAGLAIADYKRKTDNQPSNHFISPTFLL